MSHLITEQPPTGLPNINDVKAKMKATWEDGNYANFAKYMEPGAVEVLEGWNISANTKLLDVGCGSGQTAIPAAQRGIQVTGVDIAENLIKHAQNRAKKIGLNTTFKIGDAEELPCDDNYFDHVISMFGAMFAPQPDKVVREFARVLRNGGQLHMANWTKTSMPAQIFKCVASHVPPHAGFIPPVLWGDEETVLARLENNFTDIHLTRKLYPQWEYPLQATELVNLFRSYFGPVKKAFDKIGTDGENDLTEQLIEIYQNSSVFKNGVLTITNGEYLEVIATRR